MTEGLEIDQYIWAILNTLSSSNTEEVTIDSEANWKAATTPNTSGIKVILVEIIHEYRISNQRYCNIFFVFFFFNMQEGRRQRIKSIIRECDVTWIYAAADMGQFAGDESLYESRLYFNSQWKYDWTKVIFKFVFSNCYCNFSY